MQSLIKQSIERKKHILSYMHHMSFQIRVYRAIKCKQFPLGQSHFPHQTNTHHTIRYAIKCTEKPDPRFSQRPLVVPQAN